MQKKILLIGSNFAIKTHFKIIKSLFSKPIIYIVSPNIKSKDNILKKNINLMTNFKTALEFENFDIICCCTKPQIQDEFIKYFVKKKIYTNFLMLEKPITIKKKVYYSLINYIKKKKIKISINYTYSNLSIFKKLQKMKIKNLSNCKLVFELSFLHHYFKDYSDSWKNFIAEGGGIINYYLNHVLYSLIKIFGNIKLKDIKLNFDKKKNLTNINIFFSNKKTYITFLINMNEKKNKHRYNLYSQNLDISFGTNCQNWYKKYFLKINYKKKDKIFFYTYKENIISLIKKNYIYLLKKKKNYKNYIKKLTQNEIICHNINKRLLKYDFKKV